MKKQHLPPHYFLVRPDSKSQVLKHLIRRQKGFPVMVVCRSALDAVQLAVDLLEAGFTARAFCGHMPADLKERLQRQVDQGRVEVLLVTFASLQEAKGWALMPPIYYDMVREGRSPGLALLTLDEWKELRKEEGFRNTWRPGIGAALRPMVRKAGYHRLV